jgi:hypothetical protein
MTKDLSSENRFELWCGDYGQEDGLKKIPHLKSHVFDARVCFETPRIFDPPETLLLTN